MKSIWQSWRRDKLVGRILRNSGYLFSSNSINLVLSIVQSSLSTKLLGPYNFGVLGIITVFASTINRLFSFRMGEVVVKYAGDALVHQDTGRAAAVVKAAALTEAITSMLAFLFLILVAPLGAVYFAGDAGMTPWIILYGLIIPGNLVAETSMGVLQLAGQFGRQAWVNIVQGVITVLIIAAAYLAGWGLPAVLLAYLVGKIILGTGPAVLAWRSLNPLLGKSWWKASFALLPPRKELIRFALGTNLSATINLLVRDSEPLWLAYFIPDKAVVGYYKLALAINNLVLMPITPFISTTYPEINRCAAENKPAQLRQLLKRVTLFSGAWTLASALGLALFGQWIILIYSNPKYLPAYPAMLVLLIGFGAANIFFWNRNLMLVFNLPGYMFKVMAWCGAFKVLLTFVLVPRFGYLAEAALLSGYFVISVGLLVWRGLSEANKRERLHLAATLKSES
jgi:O-antigen/teichoic acid export membrane protein